MYQSITDWAAAPSRKVVTLAHIPARVRNCAELRSQRFNLRSRARCADSARDVTSCAPRVSLPGRHSLSISGEVLPNRLPHRSPAPCVCVRGQNEGVEYKLHPEVKSRNCFIRAGLQFRTVRTRAHTHRNRLSLVDWVMRERSRLNGPEQLGFFSKDVFLSAFEVRHTHIRTPTRSQDEWMHLCVHLFQSLDT